MVQLVNKRLDKKVALVTGAGQGLGEALAHRLAAEGCAAVSVADIDGENAKAVAEAIATQNRCRTMAFAADVTDPADVEDMVTRTRVAFEALDILVANAGILKAADITEFPIDEWRRVMEVNLFGYFLCARAVARVMVQQKSGVIIQINSKSGKKGSFRNSAYAASKFGGIGLTESIALDLAPHGIRVNAVCPGNLLDGTLWQDSLYEQYARNQGITVEEVRRKYESQVPLGRGCTYEDVANVVVFLASEESSYMTGQAINITGGQEMR
jgi:sorbitol-6-phosphate 2-dehydrogenase